MDKTFGWMVLNKNRKNTTKVGLALRAMELPKDFPCESKLSQKNISVSPSYGSRPTFVEKPRASR